MRGRRPERDGLWTRTRSGRAEIKVVRDENGVALAAAERWEPGIDLAWRQGAVGPLHLVSDGDRAIESAIALVYGRPAPHQLCQFHLLREYRRRERMGAVWTIHNLLALLQIRGRINQTT